MSQNKFSTEIIDLQDKHLVVNSVVTEKKLKSIYVSKPIKYSHKYCTHCGSTNIKIHAYYKRTIKYLNIGLYKSIIIYNQRRFICRDCNKSFNETSALVDKGSTISNYSKIYILSKARTKISFTDIANEMDVSVTTAIKEFKDHIADYRCHLTEVVCLDEFKASTIAGEYALIIGDPISGKILDVLPSRKQDYIYYYFQSTNIEERKKVKYIVTDLFDSYRTICKT